MYKLRLFKTTKVYRKAFKGVEFGRNIRKKQKSTVINRIEVISNSVRP
jgi:hypothetical protein